MNILYQNPSLYITQSCLLQPRYKILVRYKGSSKKVVESMAKAGTESLSSQSSKMSSIPPSNPIKPSNPASSHQAEFSNSIISSPASSLSQNNYSEHFTYDPSKPLIFDSTAEKVKATNPNLSPTEPASDHTNNVSNQDPFYQHLFKGRNAVQREMLNKAIKEVKGIIVDEITGEKKGLYYAKFKYKDEIDNDRNQNQQDMRTEQSDDPIVAVTLMVVFYIVAIGIGYSMGLEQVPSTSQEGPRAISVLLFGFHLQIMPFNFYIYRNLDNITSINIYYDK